MNPPSLPSPPPPAPAKQGPSALAVLGIGCLGLLIILGAAGAYFGYQAWKKAKSAYDEAGGDPALMAASLIVKMNPDYELVSADKASGQMTIRNKKSGDVVTMSVEEVAQGKFMTIHEDGTQITVDVSDPARGGTATVVAPDGQSTTVSGGGMAAVPAWVPIYAGGKAVPGGMHTESNDGVAGSHQLQTADPVLKVKDGLEAQWKAAGYETETSVVSTGAADMATINGTKNGGRYSLTAVIIREGPVTQVATTYQGPRE